jgi:hypothetical protein
MNTNQLMSRLVSNAIRSRPVKDLLLPALAIILGPVGCYTSAPPAPPQGPMAVVSCTSDADCTGGQVCREIQGIYGPACFTTCNSEVSQRCSNGALCLTSYRRYGEDVCMPGAGLPQTFEAAERCRTPRPCVFGESCWFPIRQEVDGMCAPLCADDTECAPGSACYRGGCLRICDERDPFSCPETLLCSYGECRPEEQVADCGWTQPGNVPANCPLGTTCFGTDADFECRALDFSGGLPDLQFFAPTGRFYPRSDLRRIR